MTTLANIGQSSAGRATPSHRYAVIMCGGIGSRFWPYSRQDRPKQFIDFFGTGRSLLQMTADRLRYIVPPSNIVVVTNDRYLSLVREQLPEIPRQNILCEPARRNTAPCIAWAAQHIYARDPLASMIVAASDHLITRERDFEAAILRAFDFVEHRTALLTLGIVPSRPETGYGYIQQGERVDTAEGVFAKVKTFTEKPDRALARVFVDSGEFFWNSGIFVWTAEAILSALRAYAPEVAAVFDNATVSFAKYEEEDAFIAANFASCPSISIDYAVMEKHRTYTSSVSTSGGTTWAHGVPCTTTRPRIVMPMSRNAAPCWLTTPRATSLPWLMTNLLYATRCATISLPTRVMCCLYVPSRRNSASSRWSTMPR